MVLRKSAKYTKSYLFKLLICLIMFIVVIAATGAWLYRYYYRYFVKEIHSNYKKNLSAVSATVDDLFYSVVQSSYMIGSDKTVSDVLMNVDSASREMPQIRNITVALNKYKIVHGGFVDSIFVMDSENNIVITSESSYDADLYFNSIAFCKKYGKQFYIDKKAPSGIRFVILDPIVVENKIDGSKKDIIPVVFYKGTNYTLKNRMVINIDIAYIRQFLDKHSLSENSEMIIYDLDGRIYSGNNEHKNFVEEYLKTGKSDNPLKLGKEIIITYKNNRALFGKFNYMALIPQEDVKRKLVPFTRAYYLCISVCAFFVLLISSYLSKSIYKPVKKLMNIFTLKGINDGNGYKNEFDLIEENIHKIIYNNSMLNAQLSVAIPVVGEKLLIKLITNKNGQQKSEEISSELKKYGINFRNKYFLIAIVKFLYPEKFNNRLSDAAYEKLCESMIPLLASFVPKNIDFHPVELENDKICLIFNSSDKHHLENVGKIIKSFSESLSCDEEIIKILSGIGRIKEGISNVNRSYSEALSVIVNLSEYSKENVVIYNEDKEFVRITSAEENRLHNYLINGKFKETGILLNDIIERNKIINPDEEGMLSLFLKLYSIFEHSLTEKGVDAEAAEGIKIKNMTLGELEPLVKKLYNDAANYFDTNDKKNLISEVVDYLKEHCDEDLDLNVVAARFAISPKYLSRAFKAYTNERFVDYINELRVTKAKALLENTDENIMEILTKVGFNSRNTFYRAFKNSQGITPAEYREKILKKTGGKV